jgi:hypothetical protein
MESGARKRAQTNSNETGFPGPDSALNRQQGGRGARSSAGRGDGGGQQPDRRLSAAGRRGGHGHKRGF